MATARIIKDDQLLRKDRYKRAGQSPLPVAHLPTTGCRLSGVICFTPPWLTSVQTTSATR